ncbi:MAG: DUF1990 domain-containing protein [Gemmataceae bacterium]|nr:DUF1990 domain-containing protein [Gemmataceae bacterium]
MKISLRDRERTLYEYLPGLKGLPLSFESVSGLPVKTLRTRVSAPMPPADLRECDLDFLFRYDVFPPEILKFFGEWEPDDRAMRGGDVIVQEAHIPPGRVGIKLLFGVRVLGVYHTAAAAGFRYGTLAGHPETGTNEFAFTLEDGALFASVHTVAAPGLFVSRLLAPVFTRPYVAFCNGRALRRMEANFLAHNPRFGGQTHPTRSGGDRGQPNGTVVAAPERGRARAEES